MIGLGSSSNLGIGLVIELRDQFTQNANKISKSMNDLQGNATKTLNTSFNQMIGVGGVMTAAGYGIMRGMQGATGAANQFQKVLINIKALGEMSQGDVLGLGKIAQSLGPKYAMTALSVAEGMEDLVKAGLKANEIPKVLEAILQTATAAGEKLEGEGGVAARMTDMIMAWGFSANNAGRVGDILARAAIESTVSFMDLSESMKYSQDILRSLNFTFEESVSMMAVLGNSGIKASMAGTALGNAWREITIAAGGGSKKKNLALHALGLGKGDLKDAAGNLKRPIELIEMLKNSLKGFSGVDKQNLLTDLFGLRGKRAISPLMDALDKDPSGKRMGKSLKEMLASLTNESAGSNLKILQEKMQGAIFQQEQFRANWENIKISIGSAFSGLTTTILPYLNKGMEKLNRFLQTGFGQSVVKAVAIFGMLLIAAGGVLIAVGLLGKALNSGMVGFNTMGKAGVWVWNKLIAKALTYLGIMRGIQANERLNKAGSIVDAVTGRIKVPAFKRAATRGGKGIFGMIANLIPGLGRMGGSLGGVTTGLLRFIPIIGWVVTVMGLLAACGVTLKDQFNLVIGTLKYIVGTIINAIMGIVELIPGVDLGGGGYFERQADLGHNAFNPNSKEYWGTESQRYRREVGYGSDNVMPKDYHNGQANKGSTNVHIYVDGEKKLAQNIKDGQENTITSWYGLNQ